MIHVDRNQVAVPPPLVAANGKAARELESNTKLARDGRYAEMTFRAYKDASVVQALLQLFKGKCAYCESRYVAQQPGDVEHFRPKAEVAVQGKSGKVTYKRGYYWLAADWENLLPSCRDCNSPRRHEIRGGAGKRVLGKANWFPVAPESRRAKTAAAVAREPYLLLNPCRDDPDLHLTFDDDGTIHPRSVRRVPSPKGEAAIEYCALARLELAQERNKRGKEVLYAIDNLLKAAGSGASLEVQRHANQLATMMAADAPYSAYARSVVARHLGPLRAQLGL